MHVRNSAGTTQTQTAERRLSTVVQAAGELNVSPRSVWRLLGLGELKAVRLGRATRVTRESIDAFIEKGGAR